MGIELRCSDLIGIKSSSLGGGNTNAGADDWVERKGATVGRAFFCQRYLVVRGGGAGAWAGPPRAPAWRPGRGPRGGTRRTATARAAGCGVPVVVKGSKDGKNLPPNPHSCVTHTTHTPCYQSSTHIPLQCRQSITEPYMPFSLPMLFRWHTGAHVPGVPTVPPSLSLSRGTRVLPGDDWGVEEGFWRRGTTTRRSSQPSDRYLCALELL